MARELGYAATRVARLDAFATNEVYEVDAGELRLVVKTSTMPDALRAEAWACARAERAGLPAPTLLCVGRLGTDDGISALIMNRIDGRPIPECHPALSEVGVRLRSLHDVRLPRFGSLAEASWDEWDRFSLTHHSWLDFLNGICSDARSLEDRHAVAASVADAAAATIDTHAAPLAAVEVGSLCHGDLKPTHILIDAGRVAGVIDWGDAAVGDPLWDIARFAHRTDAESLRLLLEGYRPDPAMADELVWRLPLYGALWTLVDAVVADRLGCRVDASLEVAKGYLSRR